MLNLRRKLAGNLEAQRCRVCLRMLDILSGGRTKKTTPAAPPSKAEKLERVQEIARQILEFKADDEVKVIFLDESHFPADPYVVRGWDKNGVPFFLPDARQSGKPFGFWRIRAGNREFLLEERTAK